MAWFHIQCIPRNMDRAYTALCFVVFSYWMILSMYPSGYDCFTGTEGNIKIGPVPVNNPKRYWYTNHVNGLINWGRVTHICVSKINHHWSREWFVAWSAPSHYLNQCWIIVHWNLKNKLQWNLNKICTFTFKKMHLKMSSVKWRPFCLGLNMLRTIIQRQQTAKYNHVHISMGQYKKDLTPVR